MALHPTRPFVSVDPNLKPWRPNAQNLNPKPEALNSKPQPCKVLGLGSKPKTESLTEPLQELCRSSTEPEHEAPSLETGP